MQKVLALLSALIIPAFSFVANAQSVPDNYRCSGKSYFDSSIIVNGDFSLGNTGFSTTYSYCNTGNCLFPLADNGYAIGATASHFHVDFSGVDHTTGTGNFMMINGQNSSLLPWGQTVSVDPGSSYLFSLWISSMDTLPYPGSAIIKVLINGETIGSISAPVALNTWVELSVPWMSGTATSAVINIVDSTSDWDGYDYGLDDISLRKCVPGVTAVENELMKNVVIQPNPSDGIFSISDCAPGSRVEVYNAIGRRVFSKNDLSSSVPDEIDLSGQPDGIYLVRLISQDSRTTGSGKVVIKR